MGTPGARDTPGGPPSPPAPEPKLLVRDRLLTVLARRHRVRLIAIEAPAGFGRTTLIDQALAAGPRRRSDRDLRVCVEPAEPFTDVLERVVAQASAPLGDGQVAALIDDVHRCAELDTLVEVIERLPDHLHLVVSARQGALPSLARLVASGQAEVLAAADLALRPEEVADLASRSGRDIEELDDLDIVSWPALAGLALRGADHLIADYLATEVVGHLPDATADLLGALACVGGGGAPCVDHLRQLVGASALDRRTVEGLPLVALDDSGMWPHPIWADATAERLDARARRAVLRVAVDDRLGREDLLGAGQLAAAAADPEALARTVCRALATQPPAAPFSALEAWAGLDLLPAGAPERVWLDGVLAANRGGSASPAIQRLESARSAFEQAGRTDDEVAVVLQLGALARRINDLELVGRMLARAEALAAGGDVRAGALAALGRAVVAQLLGDYDGAVRALVDVAPGALQGDWAAQVHMVRGTNLALAGESDDARRSFEAALGLGSPTSRALAHDLLATTRWFAGDADGALRHTDRSLALASVSAPALVATARAARSCYLAFLGHDVEVAPGSVGPGEAAVLADLAVAVCRLARGDEAGAQAVLDRQPEPAGQPVRSDLWRASLQTALGAGDDWADQAARLRSFELAVQAGRAAAEHRRGGPPVGDQHRPYLPAVWCAPRPATVRIQLLGGAAIELDRRPVDAPAWRRQRVRELALHLAVRSDVGRHAVAAALWPELDEAGGARNLRVNLTHLLDLLDPDRPRGKGSDLVEDAAGVLRFSSDPRLFVDLREQDDAVSAILEAAIGSEGTVAVLAAADRLLGLPSGPVLGGSPVGEWFEPVRRRLEERLLRSAVLAGERAIGVGDGDLARELAERMLSVDPWAEQAHRLKIAAALARGDADAARRAVRQTFEALGELGVQPEPATLALARRGRLAVR